MSSKTGVSVEIDGSAGLAYIRFSSDPVVKTRAVTDMINVDLDQYGVAVGIEVLDLDADLPITQLVADFHVPGRHEAVLRLMRPNLTRFVYQGQNDRGQSSTVGVSVPC